MDSEPTSVDDELNEIRWSIRGDLINAVEMWMIAHRRNESCGEGVDFADALEKLIDFKIEQALKALNKRCE